MLLPLRWTLYQSGVVSVTGNSGEHRLANARSIERKRAAKDTYQSIDWNSPIFGEQPVPVFPVPENIPEQVKPDFTVEQNELTEIDREIQSLLKTVIAQEGEVAELAAIEKSIRETDQRLLEAERISAERLQRKRLALLLLLSAA